MNQTLDLPVELDEVSDEVSCEACDSRATHRTIYHDCNRELICTKHAAKLAGWLRIIKVKVRCQGCRQMFDDPNMFVWIEPL